MKQIYFISLIAVLIVASSVLVLNASAAGSSITSILTNAGTVQGPVSGVMPIIGGNDITTSGNGTHVTIQNTHIYQISPVTQVNWNSNTGKNYYSYDFALAGQTAKQIDSLQTDSGKIVRIIVTPVEEHLTAPLKITLYQNGKTTGIGANLPNDMQSHSYNNVYAFGSSNNLEWNFSTTGSGVQSALFNIQVVVSYDR